MLNRLVLMYGLVLKEQNGINDKDTERLTDSFT